MSIKILVSKAISVRDSFLKIAEIILATIVFCIVLYFAILNGQEFFSKDWSGVTTMYEFISFVLLILLGFELTRLILIHNIKIVMELMLLIISRKMLYPNLTSLDLLLCTIAFCLTIGSYYLYQRNPKPSLENLTK